MTENQIATSAVGVVVETVNGMAVDQARETLFSVGAETLGAEKAMAVGKNALDVLDANLNDLVKGANYVDFMQMRGFHVAGAVDRLDSVEAAQKRWERQINRLVSGFQFVRPKSEVKDSVKKSEKRLAREAELKAMPDEEIKTLREDYVAMGDDKSLKLAVELGKEIKSRTADADAEARAEIKALADKITARVKALIKKGGDDVGDRLTEALFVLG